MENKLKILMVLSILGGISRGTYRRLIAENNLPKPENIGRQQYQETKKLYKWLSTIAKKEVVIGDKLLSSKQLEKTFKRSPTWVWLKFQKNEERKAKAIYIRSRPYWLKSEVLADEELKKYLSVLEVA